LGSGSGSSSGSGSRQQQQKEVDKAIQRQVPLRNPQPIKYSTDCVSED